MAARLSKANNSVEEAINEASEELRRRATDKLKELIASDSKMKEELNDLAKEMAIQMDPDVQWDSTGEPNSFISSAKCSDSESGMDEALQVYSEFPKD